MKKIATAEIVKQCTKYAGTGFLVRPDASKEKKSPVLTTVELQEFALNAIERLEELKKKTEQYAKHELTGMELLSAARVAVYEGLRIPWPEGTVEIKSVCEAPPREEK